MQSAKATPQGIRSDWMLAGGWIAIVLGMMGAAASSGGTMPGFLAAVVLNPILWLAIYWFWRSTQVKCPHCGGLNSIARIAVGATVHCLNCRNSFVKPCQSGSTPSSQPIQVLIAPVHGPSEHTPVVQSDYKETPAAAELPETVFARTQDESVYRGYVEPLDHPPPNLPAHNDSPEAQMIFTVEDAIKFREYEESL